MDDDSEKLAGALSTIGTTGDSPEQPQTEGGPVSPAPPPTIEAFVGYKDRIAADTDGSIAAMMRSYADAQPPEVREKLENDVDTFIGVWDKFASAFPSRPSDPPPQAPPPAPREFVVPSWRRQQIEREARRSSPVLDAAFSIGGGGVMPLEGTEERLAAKQHAREVNEIRQAIRENPANRDLEYRLAEKLFPDASKWKPDHGPENG